MGTIITGPLNVYIGEGRPSFITWDEFKETLETKRNLLYDDEALSFYQMRLGTRHYFKSYHIESLAGLYGHYDDMSEYLTNDWIW